MKSAVIESLVAPTVREFTGHTRPPREDRESARPTRWGALYGILAASVGLCVGGSRLVAAVGHSALIQYGVVLAILWLLVAWVRSQRAALSPGMPGTHACSRQPFSVIHVAFSPGAVESDHGAFSAPPDAANCGTAVR